MNHAEKSPFQGVSYLHPGLAPSEQISDTKSNDDRSRHGGDGGGGGNVENLEKRVGRLEEDVADIKLNVAMLTARSENFATTADVMGIRTEMATLTERSENFATKADVANIQIASKADFSSLQVDFSNLQAATKAEFSSVHAEIAILKERSENFATKTDLQKMAVDINTRLTYSILIPLILVVIGYLAKQFLA